MTTAAIDAGIARAALDDTVAFVRHSARPWIDAGVARASDDPLTIYHIGQLDSRLAAADALLERAGRVLDRYKNDLSEEHVAEASLAVARAKIWTTEVALEAASRLFELGGTRATGESLNLDRHWRNARVHTLHDPVRWKYQLLGNWVLNGIRPQRHDWN
nr:acyl-CoA dehydrogenase family protein [uncultured Klebsiella sp.]